MKKIIFIAAAIAVISSCRDFLTENPSTQLSEETVYTTPEMLEAHANGCIRAFSSSVNGYAGRWHEYIHSASGLIHWKGTRNTNIWLSSLWLTKFSDDGSYVFDFYKTAYAGINRCNKLIDAMDNNCPLDETIRTQIKAEAMFYRAVQYFTLVRMFGDICMLLDPARSLDDVNKPRSKYDKVYIQILKDLKYAEEHMRTKEEQLMASGNPARPFNMAATAYKAAVYLQIGSLLSSPDDNFWDNNKPERKPDFSEIGIKNADDAMQLAYDTAKKVIDSGQYSLCPTYAQLFRWTQPEDFLLPERIFVIESNNLSTSNIMATYACPLQVEQATVAGHNPGRIRPSRFLFQTWCEKYNGTFNGTYYTDCKDPRLGVTMWYNKYHSDVNGDVICYPAAQVNGATNIENQPYFKKYWDPTFNDTGGNGDLYMMRLAEMYLTAAEAAASLSADGMDDWAQKAVDNVNVILARARHTSEGEAPEPANWALGKFSSKDELIHAIVWEREFEMSFECHEFFDTHRRGAKFLSEHIAVPANVFLHQSYQAKFAKSMYPFTATFPETAKYKGVGFDEIGLGYPESIDNLRKSLVCGFPQNEMEYNTAITGTDAKNDFDWK